MTKPYLTSDHFVYQSGFPSYISESMRWLTREKANSGDTLITVKAYQTNSNYLCSGGVYVFFSIPVPPTEVNLFKGTVRPE
jgi:hypothetical protein